MNVYVYLEPPAGALDTSLVIYWLDSDIDSSLPNSQLVKLCDQLEAESKLRYLHHFIPMLEINRDGGEPTARRYLELLLPEFIYKHKIKESNFCRNYHCPPSYYYPLVVKTMDESPGLLIGQTIARYKRIWWAKNIAHSSHPHYQWNKNYGIDNYAHAKTVMRYGADFYSHYKDFLVKIPQYWLRQLRNFDMQAVCCRPYTYNRENWWTKLFNKDFYSLYNKEDRQEALTLSEGLYPEEFIQSIAEDLNNYLRLYETYLSNPIRESS